MKSQDGSGGEYVLLEDDSIGFISSEGEVGRIAESLSDLLTLLIHIGNKFDFNCKWIYQNQEIIEAYCKGYLSKIRTIYKDQGNDRDMIRADIAKSLSLGFDPNQLPDLAFSFYNSASRKPKFSCRYLNGDEEYTGDFVISDVVSICVTEYTGITRQEIIETTKHGS